MSSKFRFDDKSLQQQMLHACAELKNTDVCTEPHIFSQRMRERMERTFTQERRHRLWQKTKMILAVLLTLLVALSMVYTYLNYDRIATAVEEFWNTESEPPYGRTPKLVISAEIEQSYQIVFNHTIGRSAGEDYSWDGYALLINRDNGQQIEIRYAPTQLKETYDPDDGVLVWGVPAEISGVSEKVLRWVWPFENNGVYFTVRSTVSEKELFRVVEGISIR